MLHRIAIMVAAIAVGSAGIATDALARGGSGGGGGGGHFGGGMGGGHFGRMGEGHFGGAMSEGYLGGVGHLGGRAEHRRYRGWGPYGYYGDNGYYNPSIVAPDEQPTVALDEQPAYPTAAYPYVKPPRSRCSTQTYKVPSEAGGKASVNVVRC